MARALRVTLMAMEVMPGALMEMLLLLPNQMKK